jgi:tRNA(Ile)-lysidine synthase
MSQSLKGDYSFVMETLEKAWHDTVIRMDENTIVFKADLLVSYSIGLQRNLIKHAMQTLRPAVDVTFSALERAVNMIGSETNSSRVDLKAGLYMFCEADSVFICTLDAELPFNLWPQMIDAEKTVPVHVPGQVVLAGGWKLTCERWRLPALAKEQAERNDDQFQVWLDAEDLPETLQLRVRQPGEHFVPLGMDGHTQKLSDFFVNEKMPQRAREHWPLLCNGDEIIWVPGYRPAHPYRLKTETRKVVYFSVMRPPEKFVE